VTDANTHILIVDDSNTTRKILRKILNDAGLTNVDEAADGSEAWEKLSSGGPGYALVFADWHMPRVDGLQLLQMVRQDETLKSLPFIMTTAERKKPEVERAVLAGATYYVVKPFDPETIRRALQKALAPAEAAGPA
jgi:two-component system chemotaxis response regulator CheY